MPATPSKVAIEYGNTRVDSMHNARLHHSCEVTVHAPGPNLSSLYDVCLPQELVSSKVVDMTEKLVDNMKLTTGLLHQKKRRRRRRLLLETNRGVVRVGDAFVHKQAMTFIDLIMSVKDNPEVPYSELWVSSLPYGI